MSAVYNRRTGLSLVEIMIGIALVGLVATHGTRLLTRSSQTQSESVSSMALNEQARSVLERITYAVMGAAPSTLGPDPGAAWDTPQLRYQLSMGLQDGKLVLGDTEEIGVLDESNRLRWRSRPGELDERSVIWSNAVRPFLEGELPNGVDDNGNGLVDESGISFTIDGDLVTIRLTLESPRVGMDPLMRTIEARVVCRN